MPIRSKVAATRWRDNDEMNDDKLLQGRFKNEMEKDKDAEKSKL